MATAMAMAVVAFRAVCVVRGLCGLPLQEMESSTQPDNERPFSFRALLLFADTIIYMRPQLLVATDTFSSKA